MVCCRCYYGCWYVSLIACAPSGAQRLPRLSLDILSRLSICVYLAILPASLSPCYVLDLECLRPPRLFSFSHLFPRVLSHPTFFARRASSSPRSSHLSYLPCLLPPSHVRHPPDQTQPICGRTRTWKGKCCIALFGTARVRRRVSGWWPHVIFARDGSQGSERGPPRVHWLFF